ncbi:phospholipase A2-alpha [Neltuma alba]|uniref:phospholipase A2-alpha n=1 Tax=Neltuma alba TaxID=207710 RepID=UPI0010A3C1A9|nr:phospholipase A2-alpha-like [Prosopis alba]XP_028778145.1 phospholipase A2-alpha-like [Prosopis alba]
MLTSMKSLVFSLTFLLNFFSVPLFALNIGVETTGIAVSVSKECSKTCESSFCSVPPLLRYGKYCGLLYSGCPGEAPCDGLDACCMKHDQCVQAKNNDYLSQQCSQTFINCMESFRNNGGATFKGNKCDVDDVIRVIKLVMEAALVAGRVLHKP